MLLVLFSPGAGTSSRGCGVGASHLGGCCDCRQGFGRGGGGSASGGGGGGGGLPSSTLGRLPAAPTPVSVSVKE